MAHREFTDQMRDMCENWNLSRDAALLEHLENLSKTIIQESEGILQSVKKIEFDVNRTAISVSTSRNSLQALSDTQFIENKIEEIEELAISENSEKFGSHSKQEDSITSPSSTDCIRTSILAGVKIIDDNFEVIPIPKNDSDSEDDDEEVILKAQNKFLSRPTPHLIGSTDFFRDNTVGILELSSQEESEDEMPSPKSTGSLNEEIPSLSQLTEPTPTTPSMSYPTPLYRPVETSQTGPPLTPSFQDQLSEKLQSTAQNDLSDIHHIIGKTGPPQLFPSSGSTSEDENSSLFDQTPPSSKQTLSESVLPTSSITQENLPAKSVDPPSESENVPPKKLIGDREKSITSSLLNEMLSKNILQNNAIKKEQPKNEPESVKVEPKAVSPELFEKTDSFLPKPPKRTQTSQKSVKSSLAKSLFESSSDEDEAPQWIPDNSRNQERFHSDIKNIQGNSYSEKVPPPYIPNSITSVDNAAIVNTNVPLDQEKIASPVNKYTSNLTKVLPDITHPKPLKKSLPSENTQQFDRNSGKKVAESSKKEAKPNKEPNNKTKTKVPSIFDESDEEIIDYPKTSKTTQPPSNVMSKPEHISNQGKKKIVSLFDDDSDDDIMSEPPKTVNKEQSEPELRSEIPRNEKSIPRANKTNQQITKELNQDNNFDNENNYDIFSEVSTKPKYSTSSNPSKAPESKAKTNQPTNKNKDDDTFVFNKTENTQEIVKKPVVSLFSDSDSEDDLFAIPKSSRESKPSSSLVLNDDDLFGIPKPYRESFQPIDSGLKDDILKPKPESKPSNSGVKDYDDLFAIPKPKLANKPTAVKENGLFVTPKPKLDSISAVKDEDVYEIPRANSDTKPMDEDELFSIPKINSETKRSDSMVKEDDLFVVAKPNLETNSVVNKTNVEKPSQKVSNASRSDIFDEIDSEANTQPGSSVIATFQTNESEVLNTSNKLSKAVDAKVEPSITNNGTTLKTSVIRSNALNLFSDDNNSDKPENVTSLLSNSEEKVEEIRDQKELPSRNSSENISELPKDVNIKSTAVNKANGKDDEMFKINVIKETPPPFVKYKDELNLFTTDKKNTIDLFNSNDSENSDSELWDNIPKSKTTPRNINNEIIVEPVPNEVKDSTQSKFPAKQEKVLDKEKSSQSKLEIPPYNDSGDDSSHQINKEADTQSPKLADSKKSLNLLENNQPQTVVKVDEEKSISSSKVHSLVNSFSLSSESEPSSPLFPEDKSVRSVKVTTEAKIITKTNKDNLDGIVSSVVKKPEKLPASMKLNINLAGLVPGQTFTKKTIDSLKKNEKTPEDPYESDRTPDLLPSTASDISPQSDLTSPETGTGFLPSLTKGRAKILNKRKPPTKRRSMKSSDLSQDTTNSDSIVEPPNKETATKDSMSAIPTHTMNQPVVFKESLSAYSNEGQSSIETKNTIVKLTNENKIQGSSETKNTTVNPSTDEKKALPKASDSILEDNFLDKKKISIFDNSDDEDDIFNEIVAKKSQVSTSKQSSSLVQKSEVSKIAVSKPESTDIKTTSKSSSKPIANTSSIATAINTTVKDTKPENISNPELEPVEAKIKPPQTQRNDSSNSSKTLFSNANKLKKNPILFNDEDDDDLFGPISKAQNISTRKISNASNDKEIVTKSSENVNKPSVDKPLNKSDPDVNKPMKPSETKIERGEDILNRESDNIDNTNKTNDKPPAKASVKSEVNNMSNSKPSANSSVSRETNSKKNTLFGDDDSDEDIFESLNRSKTKDNYNNNKIDNNGKLFNDNQSDDDDLFKISSKDVSSGSKKSFTSSKKTVPQNQTREYLEDPLSKF
uniref:WASH complex subunit FAM21 n=1 Tax=Cacopsylla melanoneura TaxID=428564 RepID=A0A8D8ZVW8_9HEMI